MISSSSIRSLATSLGAVICALTCCMAGSGSAAAAVPPSGTNKYCAGQGEPSKVFSGSLLRTPDDLMYSYINETQTTAIPLPADAVIPSGYPDNSSKNLINRLVYKTQATGFSAQVRAAGISWHKLGRVSVLKQAGATKQSLTISDYDVTPPRLDAGVLAVTKTKAHTSGTYAGAGQMKFVKSRINALRDIPSIGGRPGMTAVMQRQLVVSHEFGHAFGIDDHVSVANSGNVYQDCVTKSGYKPFLMVASCCSILNRVTAPQPHDRLDYSYRWGDPIPTNVTPSPGSATLASATNSEPGSANAGIVLNGSNLGNVAMIRIETTTGGTLLCVPGHPCTGPVAAVVGDASSMTFSSEELGGLTVTEVSLFDDQGRLVAVLPVANLYFPPVVRIDASSVRAGGLLQILGLGLSNTDVVEATLANGSTLSIGSSEESFSLADDDHLELIDTRLENVQSVRLIDGDGHTLGAVNPIPFVLDTPVVKVLRGATGVVATWGPVPGATSYSWSCTSGTAGVTPASKLASGLCSGAAGNRIAVQVTALRGQWKSADTTGSESVDARPQIDISASLAADPAATAGASVRYDQLNGTEYYGGNGSAPNNRKLFVAMRDDDGLFGSSTPSPLLAGAPYRPIPDLPAGDRSRLVVDILDRTGAQASTAQNARVVVQLSTDPTRQLVRLEASSSSPTSHVAALNAAASDTCAAGTSKVLAVGVWSLSCADVALVTSDGNRQVTIALPVSPVDRGTSIPRFPTLDGTYDIVAFARDERQPADNRFLTTKAAASPVPPADASPSLLDTQITLGRLILDRVPPSGSLTPLSKFTAIPSLILATSDRTSGLGSWRVERREGKWRGPAMSTDAPPTCSSQPNDQWGLWVVVGVASPPSRFIDSTIGPTMGRCFEYRLVIIDLASNITTSQSTAVFVDSVGPSGGGFAPGTHDRFLAQTNVRIELQRGTDPLDGQSQGTGIVARRVMRRSTTLDDDHQCNLQTWTGWSVRAENLTTLTSGLPTWSLTDAGLADAKCYQYRIEQVDRSGNVADVPSDEQARPIIKIDLVEPKFVPVIQPATTNRHAYVYNEAPDSVWIKNDTEASQFVITEAPSSSPFARSGIRSVVTPRITGSGPTAASQLWGSGAIFPGTGQPPYLSFYTARQSASVSGTGYFDVTASSNAERDVTTSLFNYASATKRVRIRIDNSPPIGGAITAAPKISTTGFAQIAVTMPVDLGAGLRELHIERRKYLTIVGGTESTPTTCFTGTSEPWVRVGQAGGSLPSFDQLPEDNRCYGYRLVATDNTGNEAIWNTPGFVFLDETPPFARVGDDASNPWIGPNGAVKFVVPVSDFGSGVDKVQVERSVGARSTRFAPCVFTPFAMYRPDIAGTNRNIGNAVLWNDTQLADATCYRYRFTFVDVAGNQSQSESGPYMTDFAPLAVRTRVVARDNPSHLYVKTPGSTKDHVIYINTAGAPGSFDVIEEIDPMLAGGLHTEFPEMASADGATWGSARDDLDEPFQATYRWSDAPLVNPNVIVRGDNRFAGIASHLAFVRDVAGPTGGAISYDAEPDANGHATVQIVAGADSGAGRATRNLLRSSAIRSSAGCGTYSASLQLAQEPPASFIDMTLEEGRCYRYSYTETDFVGNVSVVEPATVLMTQLVASEISMTATPPASTTSDTAHFEFSSTTAGSTFTCELDGASQGACESPLDLQGLALGEHTLDVRGIGADGLPDGSSASYTWTVAAATQLRVSYDPGTDTLVIEADEPLFEGVDTLYANTDQGFAQLELDQGQGAVESPTRITVAPALSLLPGSRLIDLKLFRPGGEEVAVWDGDVALGGTAPPPTIEFDSSPPTSTPSTTARFVFHASRAGETFDCVVDGMELGPCTSPFDRHDLAVGSHDFRVYGHGADGERDGSEASLSWTVEAPNPCLTPWWDLTYGTDGYGSSPLDDYNYLVDAVAESPEGTLYEVVVADYGIRITKRHDDGSLDATFGSHGMRTTRADSFIDLGGAIDGITLGGIVIDEESRLIVGVSGERYETDDDGNLVYTSSAGIARFLPDGSLDPTYGDGGYLEFERAGGPGPYASVQMSSLKSGPGRDVVYVAITRSDEQGQSSRIYRTAAGIVDTSWANGLLETTGQFAGFDVARSGETIVLLDSGTRIIKYGPNGSVIPWTDWDGSNPSGASAIDLGTNGRFALLTQDGTVEVRVHDGPPDDHFGDSGRSSAAMNGSTSYDLEMLSNDSILVTSSARDGIDVQRLTPAGLADPTFGCNGRVALRTGGDSGGLSMSTSSLMMRDGRYLVSGTVMMPDISLSFLSARLKP